MGWLQSRVEQTEERSRDMEREMNLSNRVKMKIKERKEE